MSVITPSPSREEEKKWTKLGYKCIVSCDEAGCGCLAGPVTVCACYIPLDVNIPGINDSKKLTPKKRDQLFQLLTTHPEIKYAVVHNDNVEIDKINILQARFKGMYLAFQELQKQLPN